MDKYKALTRKFKKQVYDIKVSLHVLDIYSFDECTSLAQIHKYTMKAIQKWLISHGYQKLGLTKETIVKRVAEKNNVAYKPDTIETKSGPKYLELYIYNIGVKPKSWILICCKRNATCPS